MMAAQFRIALALDTYAGDTLHAGRAGKTKCTASRRPTQQIFFREERSDKKYEQRSKQFEVQILPHMMSPPHPPSSQERLPKSICRNDRDERYDHRPRDHSRDEAARGCVIANADPETAHRAKYSSAYESNPKLRPRVFQDRLDSRVFANLLRTLARVIGRRGFRYRPPNRSNRLCGCGIARAKRINEIAQGRILD
jgi:hypothetical protein